MKDVSEYPTRIDLCDGKYSVIYDFKTGQSECLRYGEKWRELCGDKMVLAMFDEIVELRAQVEKLKVGAGDTAKAERHNVEFSGGAPLYGAASAGTQG